jgi:phage terminase large subunit
MTAATVTKLPYKARPHALPFHARSQKSSVVVWHRRAGKTVMCITDLLEKAIQCPLDMPQYGYIAPTYKQAKKIAWRYLKKIGKPIIEKVMESELSVELVNGAVITLFGADNPDSLRGLYFDGVVVDEYGDIAPMLWGEIIAPAVADRDGWVVFIGTPKGPNHFYELYKDAANDPDWFVSTLKASESGVFSAERLAKIKRQPGMDEDTYNQEMECDFHAANKGSYYAKQLNELEAAGHMGIFPYDPTKKVGTAWDIGISDDTSIWFFQIHGENDIRIIDFWTGSGYSVHDIVADVLQKRDYVYGDFLLPHDANSKSFQTGKSTREILFTDYGIRVIIVPKLSVQDGIMAVRSTLPNVYFNIACEDLRKYGLSALVMYQRQYDEVKRVFRQAPMHDWASNPADAFRYLCLGVNRNTYARQSAPVKGAGPLPSAANEPAGCTLDNLYKDREASMRSQGPRRI